MIRSQALLRYHLHVTTNRYQSGDGNSRAKILEILKRLVYESIILIIYCNILGIEISRNNRVT